MSFADAATRYYAHPRIVTSIKTEDSLVVRGVDVALELPLALLQVLMGFVEPRTIAQALQILELDMDIVEFGRIVDDFVERGLLLLEHDDDVLGLQDLLKSQVASNPSLVADLAAHLQQGHAVLIRDALPVDFADDVHRDLDQRGDWMLVEGGHDFFQYRSNVIDELAHRTPALTRCSQLFQSSRTRRFISHISGRDCSGVARVAAAWYRPHEYASPHDDTAGDGIRAVAYVWYLTKDWRQEWGGSLFWCPTGQYLVPGFNQLLLFNVSSVNMHFVCPVSPSATSKRLTINGFWRRHGAPSATATVAHSASISPPAYGVSELAVSRSIVLL